MKRKRYLYHVTDPDNAKAYCETDCFGAKETKDNEADMAL